MLDTTGAAAAAEDVRALIGGGTVGLATVVYALSVGPLVGRLLPRLTLPPTRRP